MTDPKSFFLGAEVHEYLVAHGTPPDAVQQELIRTTAELGGISMMQIAPEQGAFMTMLTRLLDVHVAVEVGTFTGYSALCIARGLAPGGRLLCCDVSEEWTAIGRAAWDEAGVADRIDLRILRYFDLVLMVSDTMREIISRHRVDPARMRARVLLPAPFSPMRACTSPARSSKFAPLRA